MSILENLVKKSLFIDHLLKNYKGILQFGVNNLFFISDVHFQLQRKK